MRELTKSVAESAIALSLFGVRQMLRPFVAERDLSATMDATGRAMNTIQRGFVDLVFGVLRL